MQIAIPTINLFHGGTFSYINHAAALSRTSTLPDAIAAARQEERSRIGDELHDNVGQLLVTSRLLLSVMKTDPEQRGEVLPRALDLIDQTISEIRTIAQEMTGVKQKQRSLEQDLSDLAAHVRLASGADVVLACRGLGAMNLTTDQHTQVFRIVQEAVNNVLKHAAATRIEIRLAYAQLTLELEITDNGKGFDAGVVKKGLGLQNIIKRISLLNASHKLISAPGAGTSLFILLPLGARESVLPQPADQEVLVH